MNCGPSTARATLTDDSPISCPKQRLGNIRGENPSFIDKVSGLGQPGHTHTHTHTYSHTQSYIVTHYRSRTDSLTHSLTQSRFYDGTMKHGIKIPQQYKEEMLNLLVEGPPEGAAPGWIDWGDLVPSSSDDDDNGDSSSEASTDDSDSGVDYAPFLTLPKNKNGRKCRCGSDTHCTTQSHACPLNPRNRRAVCICRHPNPKPHSLAHSLTHTTGE